MHFAYFANCNFANYDWRIEVPVSKMEMTTCTHLELVIAKDSRVVRNGLIDMTVKRILTTVNHADDFQKVLTMDHLFIENVVW